MAKSISSAPTIFPNTREVGLSAEEPMKYLRLEIKEFSLLNK